MTQRLLQLDQVSFTLPDGRMLFDRLNHTFSTRATGIVGANGCGKSLLGQLLTGEQLPTNGIVRREGQVYAVAQLLEPERYPSVAALTGVEPILAALERIAQGSVDDDDHLLAVDQWDCAMRLEVQLQQIGLGHLNADSRTDALSGGERQRVALMGACYPGPTGSFWMSPATTWILISNTSWRSRSIAGPTAWC